MEMIIAVILAAATMAYVGYPLLKAKEKDEEDVEPAVDEASAEDELESQKEATYAAISELDFDYAMGNLSDKDHGELRERYKLKALALIKEIDEMEKAPPPDRDGGHAVPPADRRSGSRAPAITREDKRVAFCPSCRHKVAPDDRFCPRCGKALVAACPNCGASYDREDAYCANCGGKL